MVLSHLQHNHFYDANDLAGFNCSHVIHSLSFGGVPGVVNTLDDYKKNQDAGKYDEEYNEVQK